jgi:hypothetical protein
MTKTLTDVAPVSFITILTLVLSMPNPATSVADHLGTCISHMALLRTDVATVLHVRLDSGR